MMLHTVGMLWQAADETLMQNGGPLLICSSDASYTNGKLAQSWCDKCDGPTVLASEHMRNTVGHEQVTSVV